MTTTHRPVQFPVGMEVAYGIDFAHVVDYRVKTATNVKNGRWVKMASPNSEIEVAGDEETSPVGVVIREKTLAKYRENDRTTDYTAGEKVAVCSGPGVIVNCVSSAAIGIGDIVVCASQGRVKKWATDAANTMVGFGMSTASAADEDVLIKLLR